MPKVAVTRRVAHAAQEMFELVADVERYPEFVPLCESLRLRSRKQDGGVETLTCEMSVGYKSFRETFSTRVTVLRPTMTIEFAYLTGPFRRMNGRWRFEEQGPRDCLVHFSVDYEFGSRILALLMGSVFDRAFRRFAEAFEARADRIYGVSV
jgi:coenzyme Q-binding protein COQ10